MKTLNPIGIDTQIEDCLSGNKTNEQIILDKIKYVSDNIDKVKSVNGKKVFNAIVKDDDIWYNLQNINVSDNIYPTLTRSYYYPIRYATIIFND